MGWEGEVAEVLWHDDGTTARSYYQRFYQWGVAQLAREHGFRARGYRSRGWLGRARELFRDTAGFYPYDADHCGAYRIVFRDGRQARVVIDAHDSRHINSPAGLAWADLYFKSNRWDTLSYPDKVLPLVNGNGQLTGQRRALIEGLRGRERETDLHFVSRVWGGREHNIRLFEQLARIPCRKQMLAIFNDTDRERPETEGYRERLDRAGVPWTHDLVAPETLFDGLARSRLTMIRLGKHQCVPWRMVELLALGTDILLESPPFSSWPHPLREGVNFHCLGLRRPMDGGLAPEEDYQAIPRRITALLARSDAEMGANNVAYFERHGAPERVAAYVLQEVYARG